MGSGQSVENDPAVIELLEKINNIDLRSETDLVSKYYSELNRKITCLSSDTKEYNDIAKYLENTHGPTHKYQLKIRNIFEVYRESDYLNYKQQKKIGNIKLLWHGTRMSNYKSILINGFSNAPASNTTPNPNEICFWDVVTEAAKHCDANPLNPYGILMLADVALGEHYYKTIGENILYLPDGKNSIKWIGRYKPDKFQSIRTKYGVKIPLGTLKYRDDLKTTSCNYNEYVVHDPNQILIQYLILVDFNYNDCTIL